jgi:hypothetical protein
VGISGRESQKIEKLVNHGPTIAIVRKNCPDSSNTQVIQTKIVDLF